MHTCFLYNGKFYTNCVSGGTIRNFSISLSKTAIRQNYELVPATSRLQN